MIVFKTFLKILNKTKWMVLLYTFILILFAGFQMQNEGQMGEFVSEKPDILLINEDEYIGLTKNLVDYLTLHSNVLDIEKENELDALFYRDVNFIIRIPKGYREDRLLHKDPFITIQSTGDYQASLANMLLERYLRVESIYLSFFSDEHFIVQKINETLDQEVSLQMASKRDTDGLSRAKFFYNFSNYAILAGLVYVVCLILAIFHEETVWKRTMVSSMSYKKGQSILFLSNGLFAIFLWAIYVFLSFLLVGNVLFSIHGLLYIINSFLFSLCALSIAFFIGSILKNKDAMNGIVNIIALGSSFLCGAFVPVEFLPKSVLSIARVLPSYWFIHGNEEIAILENITFETLKPIFFSFFLVVVFTLCFGIATLCVTKRKIRQ